MTSQLLQLANLEIMSTQDIWTIFMESVEIQIPSFLFSLVKVCLYSDIVYITTLSYMENVTIKSKEKIVCTYIG